MMVGFDFFLLLLCPDCKRTYLTTGYAVDEVNTATFRCISFEVGLCVLLVFIHMHLHVAKLEAFFKYGCLPWQRWIHSFNVKQLRIYLLFIKSDVFIHQYARKCLFVFLVFRYISLCWTLWQYYTTGVLCIYRAINFSHTSARWGAWICYRRTAPQ